MLHTSITGIRTGTCRGERVVGDVLHMMPSLSRPLSSQPTLTGRMIGRIKVEAITAWSADAFLLTSWDSGRRISFFSSPVRCVLFSRPLPWAF